KVDEVGHLQVIGLFLDENNNRLHVFARTHNAPYFFYYRYFDTREYNWYPWVKMQIDIPTYDITDSKEKIILNGCYLIPVVWNDRLLVFFPHLTKKTIRSDMQGGITAKKDAQGNLNVPVQKPRDLCEIKIAWSEYRNGKWTQKQLSKDAL